MEKDFKESIEKSKVAAKEFEKKVTEVAGEFSESAGEFWNDLQVKLEKINVQLAGSYDEMEKAGPEGSLKANIEALEANEKFQEIKESLESFSEKVSKNAKESFDMVSEKALLAKKEAGDLWEEKGPGLKESIEGFGEKVSKNAKEGFDVVSEKALSAKKEAGTLWEDKSPTLKEDFAKSKEKVTAFSVKAIDEITEFYEKMLAKFNEKKNS